MEKIIYENDLMEQLKPILSVDAHNEEDYIYWKQGSNFDCSLFLLSRTQRKERLDKIRLLQKSLFSCLDGLKEDIFIVSQLAPFEEWGEYWHDWFKDRYNIKKNVFYREIIKEANKSKIQLMTQHVIDCRKNKVLAEKFFRGNMEYLTGVCFCAPGLGFAVQPFHHIELRLFSINKDRQYKNFVNELLSFSYELEFSRD